MKKNTFKKGNQGFCDALYNHKLYSFEFKHLLDVVQSKHSVVVAERKRLKAKNLNNSCKKSYLRKTHM